MAGSWPAWPVYGDDEVEAAAGVLRSGRVNQWTGPDVGRFEDAFATRMGSRHALALGNGTVALELALEALGIGPGDEVLVPARTFIATAAAVVRCSATPIVCDVDAESGGLTVATAEAARTPKTRAVVPVHLGGWPCDMPALRTWADEHGLAIVEDCAQAHGATVDGRCVGTWGDVSAFSFCQDKILSTGGEGGMVTTDDEALFDRIWSLRDHGKDRARALAPAQRPGFRWLHDHFGTNARMTGPQAAIGVVQLAKLDAWIEARRQQAAGLRTLLADRDDLHVPVPPVGEVPYRVYVTVAAGADSGSVRDAVIAHTAGKAPVFTGSCGQIQREAAFAGHGLASDPLPVAARLEATSLAFPVHPGMEGHIERLADVVSNALDHARA